MAESELFPSLLLDKALQDALPKSYILRPLARGDYSKGFFENFKGLASTGDVTREQFLEQFDWMKTKADVFYNVVIEHDDRIVANGMLMVERKFIWGLGKVGHIEEISVSESHQGKGLGKCIIEALNSVARNVGCLKTILDCDEDHEPFYIKCGYERTGLEMTQDFEAMQEWRAMDRSSSDSDI